VPEALGSSWPSIKAGAARATGDFSVFFAESFHQTLGLVTLSCGNPTLAEEVTQEAFARALDRWSSVAAMRRPERWVLKVASNMIVDHVRKTRRESPLDPGIKATVPDQVEEMWMRWNLERLTPMQRASIVLRYRDGLRIDEIAALIDRSTETVRTHLRLARRRLRDYCGEEL
jgi:RNA polymerase sigma-70 factor (ECF subfamily)